MSELIELSKAFILDLSLKVGFTIILSLALAISWTYVQLLPNLLATCMFSEKYCTLYLAIWSDNSLIWLELSSDQLLFLQSLTEWGGLPCPTVEAVLPADLQPLTQRVHVFLTRVEEGIHVECVGGIHSLLHDNNEQWSRNWKTH